MFFSSRPPLAPADFETAIAATGYGKFNFLLLLVALPCCMCTVFETTTISYVLPSAECDLHLSLVDKGTLNAVTYGGRYKYLRTHFSATAANNGRRPGSGLHRADCVCVARGSAGDDGGISGTDTGHNRSGQQRQKAMSVIINIER